MKWVNKGLGNEGRPLQPNRGPKFEALNVRINGAAAKLLLDKFDQTPGDDSAVQKRVEERYRFRRPCLVKFVQPGGTTVTLKAPTRDLSRGGLAFLHHSFVHAGTVCQILLASSDKKVITTEGVVVRCEYLDAGIHSVSVRFTCPIDVSSICDSARTHRVLLVDDDPQMRTLVRFLTRDQSIELVEASDGQSALDAAASRLFDIILMDVEMPVLNGLDAVKKLRESGYTGCIVALTSMNAEGDRERLLAQGFDQYLAKPIDKDALRKVFAELQAEPELSSLAEMDGMQSLISQFVDELAAISREIQKALAGGDIPGLGRLSRTLKGKAGSFGFARISEAAMAVETKTSAEADAQDLGKSVHELLRLCRRARKPS